MKSLLVGLLSVCYAGIALAQAGGWKLTKVEGQGQVTAGFIYHSESIGTQTSGGKITKSVTGLRLVCSSPDFLVQKNDVPLIAIYWNAMIGGSPQSVIVKVDGRPVEVGQSQQWNQDGQLLYRKLSESVGLLQAMKVGRSINFEWTDGSGNKRQTIFNLHDFRSDLAEFNASCKTQI